MLAPSEVSLLYIENSQLCFLDMKICYERNGDDLVNNEPAGRVIYRITTIPEWHNFHIKETQFTILYKLFTKSSGYSNIKSYYIFQTNVINLKQLILISSHLTANMNKIFKDLSGHVLLRQPYLDLG